MRISSFVDDSQVNSIGEMTVYIRIVTDDGKRFLLKSGLTSPIKFNGREFPRTVPNNKVKTSALNKKLLEVEEYCIQHGSGMPAAQLKQELAALLGQKPRLTQKLLADYIDDFAQLKLSHSTQRMYELTARKVRDFDAKATFETVNADWLRRFEKKCLEKTSINATAIQLRNIRAVFNWAIDEEITDKYPFRRFKVRQERVPIRNISVETLVALRDYPVEPGLEMYRDLFMLTFYLCGINAVDLLECKGLTNGRMVYHRRKTGRLYDLPVYPEAQAIIDKWKGKDWLLCPLDTYKNYNDFLWHWNAGLRKIGEKEVPPPRNGKVAKTIYKPLVPDITTYTARYTFATIAADLDIPRETVALCLGHAWTDVTSRYVVYDRKKIDEAVRKVIDYVNGYGKKKKKKQA